MNILVRSVIAALGDVLYVTPITARLRRKYPDSTIIVHTNYPNVFEGNPDVNGTNIGLTFDLIIDLDLAHATRRHLNAVDAYMEAAFGDHGEGEDKSIIFDYPITVNPTNCIAIHPNKSWANRTMPNDWWDEVTIGLMLKTGYDIYTLGTNIDYCPEGTMDTRGKLTLKEQAAIISACQIFLCGASGLFILAAATDTPVVVPMTINTPETCLMWRHGEFGWGYFPILADVPCIGCNSFAPKGATFVGCESPFKDPTKPDYACIGTIKPEAAIEQALKAIEWRKKYLSPERLASQGNIY